MKTLPVLLLAVLLRATLSGEDAKTFHYEIPMQDHLRACEVVRNANELYANLKEKHVSATDLSNRFPAGIRWAGGKVAAVLVLGSNDDLYGAVQYAKGTPTFSITRFPVFGTTPASLRDQAAKELLFLQLYVVELEQAKLGEQAQCETGYWMVSPGKVTRSSGTLYSDRDRYKSKDIAKPREKDKR